jgi:hypothetical protein
MQFELVPPGNHRCNKAEHAIQTFKAHFISILAGVDDKFTPLPMVPPPGTNGTHLNSLSVMDGHDRPLKTSFLALWFLAKFLSVHRV